LSPLFVHNIIKGFYINVIVVSLFTLSTFTMRSVLRPQLQPSRSTVERCYEV